MTRLTLTEWARYVGIGAGAALSAMSLLYALTFAISHTRWNGVML